MLLLLALFFGVSLAQRPSNASICDYYAQQYFGTNNSNTQLQLVQGIVSLAFGGAFNLSNISSNVIGILNPSAFDGTPVDLRPWFNGSIESTNLNNQPVGIDWLDDGGTDPLYTFLSGATTTVVFSSNTTNQYRIFSHFFLAFSHIFGCSNPPASTSTGPPLNLAYVHKYMNLNYTDIGYFIAQIGAASLHYGFSTEDTTTLGTQWNSLYNVRCASPITQNPALGPQLLSLCQADSCPLAEPNSDCAAYVNLTSNGGSGSVSQSASASATPISATFTPTTVAPTSSAAATTSAAATSNSSTPSSTLSAGAIAGIVIGAIVVLLLAIIAIVLCLRKRKPYAEERQSHPSPPMYAGPRVPEKTDVYASQHPAAAEMESPRSGRSPAPQYASPNPSIPGVAELGSYEHRQSRHPPPQPDQWGRI